HVHLLRVLHGARDSAEVLDGTEADVEVEELAERDVQRADPAADGRRERTLDADEELLERLDGILRKPRLEALETLLACEHLHPRDLPPAAIGLLDGRVEHPLAGAPDVRSGPVAADEGDDGPVGNDEFAGLEPDLFPRWNGASGVRHRKRVCAIRGALSG